MSPRKPPIPPPQIPRIRSPSRSRSPTNPTSRFTWSRKRERKEIVTALEAEQKNGVPTYVDCFRNNESRNGFRTWTGIMLQGVRPCFVLLSFSFLEGCWWDEFSGNNWRVSISFVSFYSKCFSYILTFLGYQSITESYVIPSSKPYILNLHQNIDILPPSRNKQRFPHPVRLPLPPSSSTQTNT